MQLDLSATTVFEENLNAFSSDKRYIVNIGGSRSSKTISLCQLMIITALQTPNIQISIVRKSFPSLRSSVMKDFFDLMKEYNIYDRSKHNKTEQRYTFDNGSEIEFFSVDDEQKIRGRKRHILYINEANELNYEEFTQLNLRTEKKIFVDFNPSETNSWLYELPTDQSIIIHSTFEDNPFLSEEQKRVIRGYKDTDPELWEIFGLGNRITPRQNIYAGWTPIAERPERFTKFIYGLDFGFNHPLALIKVWYHENELLLEEVIYERYLTTPQLIETLIDLGIEKNINIMADHSRPEIIKDLRNAGYNVHNADKAVKEGIREVKTYKVYYLAKYKNIEKEYQNYKWKKNGESITDEPIKLWDDAMDAIRYAVKELKRTNKGNGGPTVWSFKF